MDLGKVSPQSLEAEQSVLGSMMIDKESISTAASILTADDFYREDHKLIYNTIIGLYKDGLPVDVITVYDKVNHENGIDLEYMTKIITNVPTTANVKYYAKIVEEKAIRRKLIRTSTEIITSSYGDDELYSILNKAEKSLFNVLQNRSKDVVKLEDTLTESFSKLEYLYNNTDAGVTGIPTGLNDLDQITAGLQNSDFILLAARPAMGKTSLALNISQYAAVYKKIPVAIFSLEMSRDQLTNRILFSEALVDSRKAKTGKLDDEDWNRLARSLSPLHEAPIYIDDTPAATIIEISSKCRKLKIDYNIGLIVIDYLQLIKGSGGKSESRQQEISDISRSLKVLAKEINVPVIALSQLSRAPEQRADHRPMLSDLRDSGAIEQDADVVMFIYRDDYYNCDSNKKSIAEIILAKHRNGTVGTVEVVWLSQYTKFANLAPAPKPETKIEKREENEDEQNK